MNKISIFLILIVLVFCKALFADTILLKNGNSFKGIIIEKTDKEVLFEIAMGEVTFSHDEISEIKTNKDSENEDIRKKWEKKKQFIEKQFIENKTLNKRDKPKTARDVPEIKLLKYNNEEVQLDIYNPNNGLCPVVILLHGSAGIDGDRAIRYKRFATDFMKKGIIAINVHYFDSEINNRVETIIKTIDYAQDIYNADRRKIGLIGYSSGGAMALEVASLDDRIKLLAFCSTYMPAGFTKNNAEKLPETYMRAGTNDGAINTVYQLQKWFRELDKPFTAKIDEGYGHSIPLKMFWNNWKELVSFVEVKLKRGY